MLRTLPQFVNQEPPRPQQLIVPDLSTVPHLGHAVFVRTVVTAGNACDRYAGDACGSYAGDACEIYVGDACDRYAGEACGSYAGNACEIYAGNACESCAGDACRSYTGDACGVGVMLVMHVRVMLVMRVRVVLVLHMGRFGNEKSATHSLTFAGLYALKPLVIHVSVAGNSTVLEPSTTRSATTASAGFLERAALRAGLGVIER